MAAVEQALPKNREVEMALLGAALLTPDETISMLIEAGVTRQHFYWRPHQMVYDALLSMSEQGIPPDLITLGEYLEQKGQLDEVGGRLFLSHLLDFSTATLAPHHVDIIKKHHLSREIVAEGVRLAQAGYETTEPGAILEDAALRLQQLQDGAESKQTVMHVSECIGDLRDYLDRLRKGEAGIKTGITPLDNLIYFFRLPSYNFIYGRLKSGKTSLATNIAVSMAKQNHSVLYISLEMQGYELQERMVRQIGGITFEQMCNLDNLQKVEQSLQALQRLPVYLVATEDGRVERVLTSIRRAVTRHKVKVVFLENLDHLMPSGHWSQEHERMALTSRMLKGFVHKMAVNGYPFVLILLGQANRDARLSSDGFPLKDNVAGTDQPGRDVDLMLSLSDPEKVYDEHPDQIGVKVAAKRHDVNSFEPIWLAYDKTTYAVKDRADVVFSFQGG